MSYYYPTFTRAEGAAYYRFADMMRKLEWEIHHKFWRGEGLPEAWHEIATDHGPGPKERITLWVDKRTVKFFRATGKGWQTRMNLVLVAYAEARASGAVKGAERFRLDKSAEKHEVDGPPPGWGHTKAEEEAFEAQWDAACKRATQAQAEAAARAAAEAAAAAAAEPDSHPVPGPLAEAAAEAEMPPEMAPEAVATTPEMAPDMVETATEAASEAAQPPEEAAETAPGGTAEAGEAEVATEAVAEPAAAPESRPEAAPDSGTDSGPEPTPEPTPAAPTDSPPRKLTPQEYARQLYEERQAESRARSAAIFAVRPGEAPLERQERLKYHMRDLTAKIVAQMRKEGRTKDIPPEWLEMLSRDG